MKRTIILLYITVLTLITLSLNTSITAQDDDISPIPTETPAPALIEPAVASVPEQPPLEELGPLVLRERTSIRQGPGLTYAEVGTMGWWNQEIFAVERNRLGNWVRTVSWSGQVEGWVRTGHLMFEQSDLRLSEIPINPNIVDHDPANLWSSAIEYLYTAPIIPFISPRMQEVYALGQSLGNNSNVVTKIGDSLSASPIYLNPMTRDDYDLGPYDFLEPTIDFFADGLVLDSVGSQIGMSTYGIFDSFWANSEQCEPDESPIACEYRRSRPAIAMILFGPNDMRIISDQDYDIQMRQIVEETLALGIIPVLTTFSTHPDEEFYWVSIQFNSVLIDIASDYQVPLMNMWTASRELPDYGLDEDMIHLNHSGFEYLLYATGHETYYGISLFNLLALRTLDELRLQLEMD